MEQKTNEQWRTVKDFPLYEVSNQGRVRSNVFGKEKILKPATSKLGYKTVSLTKEKGTSVSYTKQVHRLVAEVFIPNPEEKTHIDHIDTNPSNNCVENLRWVTPKENSANPITKERVANSNRKRAQEMSKVVLVYDQECNLLSAFSSSADCARKLDLSQGNIACCCNGMLQSYKGYFFSYTPLTKDGKEMKDLMSEEKKARRDEAVKRAQITFRAKHKDELTKNALQYYYDHRERLLKYQRDRYHRLKNEREKLQNIRGTAS